MNKKFKVVSSLALAGLLSINVFSPKAFATTVDDLIKTESVGKYKNLVEGKAVVPYVLVGTEDSVTVKEIVNSNEFANVTKFNGTSIPNENTLVCTGDTFVADGTEYTVIVYGDVNKDGKINSSDALLVEEYSSEMTNLDAIQLEAADVMNDGKVNSLDSLRIKEYSAELVTPIINKVPDAEKEDVKSNYEITVNQNGKISNQNANKVKLKVKIEKTLDSEKTFTLKVIGADGEEVVIAKDVDQKDLKIPAHTDQIEVNVDLSKIPDGKIVGTMQVQDDKTETKFTTEKSTIAPKATNIITNRISTKSATLSLKSCGNTDIAKVYYEVVKNEAEKPSKIEKEITANNGEVSNVNIAEDLETDTAYDVWYVIEDSFGSKSEPQKVTITSDSAQVNKEKAVKEVKLKEELNKVSTAEFTWEATEGKTYVTTLYKDGKAVETKNVTEGSVEYTAQMAQEGTYKVEVYVEGTAMKKNSDTTTSKEVKVEKLPAVTDLSFKNENNKIILSWKNANKEEDFSKYKIELVTIDKDGKESSPKELNTSSLKASNNQYDATNDILNDTIYKAKVTVIAKDGQMAKISSDETVTEEFYRVGNPSIAGAETSEHTVTLGAQGININGKTATYKVKVFDVNENATLEEPYYTLKTTKSVEIKDGKIVIDGLDANTRYAFKLIATIDGKDVESSYTVPVRTLPELKNLTVVETEKQAQEEGKVYSAKQDTIVLNGKTIELSNYANSAKLENSMKIINALKPGDTVSIENNKVTMKLDGGASANVAERDLTNVELKDISLDVESNNFSKTLKIKSVKELTLRGKDSIFELSDVTAKKITLTDAVEVQSTEKQEYIINANSAVTINKIKISTKKDTNVTVNSSNDIEIKANSEANDLVFENKKDQEVKITFVGEGDFTSKQAGTITIKENATIKVVSDKVNVNADITVEVNNGDVNLTETYLTGNKKITVAKDAETKIEAIAKTKAPVAFDQIILKEYTDEELKETYKDDASKVKEYLNSFGIKDEKAKLTVQKDSNKVTITFDKATNEVNVQNLK